MEKFRSRREIGSNWFSDRAVDEWNRLNNNNNNNNNNTVSAQTLGSFKRRLDKFMDENDGWK